MAARILVVEDEPAIQELIAYSMRQAGHAVFSARSAEEAMDIINDALPDLLLLLLDAAGNERGGFRPHAPARISYQNDPYHHAYGPRRRKRKSRRAWRSGLTTISPSPSLRDARQD